MKSKSTPHNLRVKFDKFFQFLCGVEANKKVNRAVFWTMISTISTIFLLLFAYFQLRDVNETNSAEFAHKIKNDLYTSNNIRLITLFDDDLLIFKSDTNNFAWFQLDTIKYRTLPPEISLGIIPPTYNIFEIDALLQNFEDLAFYEKKGQVNIDYIYNQYAYYIEMLWENPNMTEYIKWQRSQPHNGYCYRALEKMHKKLKAISDNQP
jgi:hypothetical protein